MNYYLIFFDTNGKVIEVCKYDSDQDRAIYIGMFDGGNRFGSGAVNYQIFDDIK